MCCPIERIKRRKLYRNSTEMIILERLLQMKSLYMMRPGQIKRVYPNTLRLDIENSKYIK